MKRNNLSGTSRVCIQYTIQYLCMFYRDTTFGDKLPCPSMTYKYISYMQRALYTINILLEHIILQLLLEIRHKGTIK